MVRLASGLEAFRWLSGDASYEFEVLVEVQDGQPGQQQGLIQPGEPLPIEGPTRPWRTGLLAEELTRRGHEVLWWSSAFSHARKRFICRGSKLVTAPAGYQILASERIEVMGF